MKIEQVQEHRKHQGTYIKKTTESMEHDANLLKPIDHPRSMVRSTTPIGPPGSPTPMAAPMASYSALRSRSTPQIGPPGSPIPPPGYPNLKKKKKQIYKLKTKLNIYEKTSKI